MWSLGTRFQGNSRVWREILIFSYIKVISRRESLAFLRENQILVPGKLYIFPSTALF